MESKKISPFYDIAVKNNFKELTSLISYISKNKNETDGYHSVIVTNHTKYIVPVNYSKSYTLIAVENMSIRDIQPFLVSIIENLGTEYKDKTILVIFACGLSTILRKYQFNSDCINVRQKRSRCCLKCQFYLPLNILHEDTEVDLHYLCSTIENRFKNLFVIPTPVLNPSIDDIHNEVISDHISCCPHLFCWNDSKDNEEYIVCTDTLQSMEEVLSNSIKNYNSAVEKVCIEKQHLYEDFTMYEKARSSRSLLEGQRIYIKKIEQLLQETFDSKIKKGFVVDETGTIELGVEDLELQSSETVTADQQPEKTAGKSVCDKSKDTLVMTNNINSGTTESEILCSDSIHRDNLSASNAIICDDSILFEDLCNKKTNDLQPTQGATQEMFSKPSDSFDISIDEDDDCVLIDDDKPEKQNYSKKRDGTIELSMEDLGILPSDTGTNVADTFKNYDKKKARKNSKGRQHIGTASTTHNMINIQNNTSPEKGNNFVCSRMSSKDAVGKSKVHRSGKENLNTSDNTINPYSLRKPASTGETEFIAFDPNNQDSANMMKYCSINCVGRKFSKRFKRAPYIPVAITDNRMKLLSDVLMITNYSMYQVDLKSTDTIEFEKQLCCLIKSISRYFTNNQIASKKKIYFVILGTSTLIKSIHLANNFDSTAIVTNLCNKLNKFRHDLYGLDNECQVLLSPLPLTGLTQTDQAIKQLNELICESNTLDVNLNSTSTAIMNGLPDAVIYDNSYVLSTDAVASWITQCFQVRKKVTIDYIVTHNLNLKFADYSPSSTNDTATNKHLEREQNKTSTKKKNKSSKRKLEAVNSPALANTSAVSSTPQPSKTADNDDEDSTKKIKVEAQSPPPPPSISKDAELKESSRRVSTEKPLFSENALIPSVNIKEEEQENCPSSEVKPPPANPVPVTTSQASTETTTQTKIKIEKKEVEDYTEIDDDSAELDIEVPIKTISDAFAQIVAINISTKGGICQSYQGLMAVWKHAWPNGSKPPISSLLSYSPVQIIFISKVIDSAFKLLSKNTLSEAQQKNLSISANIIKKCLDEKID